MMLDTLLVESGITDEEQKKSFLQAALPPRYTMYLAYKGLPTYAKSYNSVLQFEVELGHSTSAKQLTAPDPIAMDTSAD